MIYDKKLPDVANTESPEIHGTLEWVGMDQVEVPVCLKMPDGSISKIPARAEIFVSLDNPEAKGIHMSRLFLNLEDGLQSTALDVSLLKDILDRFLDTHNGISFNSWLSLDFEYMIKRPALMSDNSGWRSYPVKVEARRFGDEYKIDLFVDVVYSSTCPCSAALSRQLNQQKFLKQFSDKKSVSVDEVADWLASKESMEATPHAQRSVAEVEISLKEDVTEIPIVELIDVIENCLATPVQSAVKREDEQEFARLNAKNLMFAEDAGRRVKKALNDLSFAEDFHAKLSHLESLHPHNAVSYVSK